MTEREIVARDVIAEGSAQTRAAVAGGPPEVIDGDRIRADYILRALDDAGLCIVPTSALVPARGPSAAERAAIGLREIAGIMYENPPPLLGGLGISLSEDQFYPAAHALIRALAGDRP